MEERDNAVKILEHIVNITAITNKWLMWCESNTPDKSVFVPSIFQMRDAYSHMIKIFGKGIETQIISSATENFNELFASKYSIKQLEEAFTHSTRAFYDCADYILLVIKQDIDKSEANGEQIFLNLRSKLLKNDLYITQLRSSKSEDINGNFENIKKWDSFLQLITTSYVFGDIELELIKISNEIQTKLNVIESKFPSEIIKNHNPNFYEEKNIILELEALPSDFVKYLKNDNFLSTEIIENPQEWCANILKELEEKLKKATEYSSKLDGLQKMMSNSNMIQRKNNLLKTIWGFISGVLSWIATNLLSSTLLFDFSVTLPDQSQTISATKMNFLLLFPFIVIFLVIFGVGYLILNIIFKKQLKNKTKRK